MYSEVCRWQHKWQISLDQIKVVQYFVHNLISFSGVVYNNSQRRLGRETSSLPVGYGGYEVGPLNSQQ